MPEINLPEPGGPEPGFSISPHIDPETARQMGDFLKFGEEVQLRSGIPMGSRAIEASIQANTDELTGLANERYMRTILSELTTKEDRLSQDPGYRPNLGLLMFDLDDFKKVNDILGHAAGNNMIKVAADVLSGSVRGSDLPARAKKEEAASIKDATAVRQHGDELAIVIPNIVTERTATEMPIGNRLFIMSRRIQTNIIHALEASEAGQELKRSGIQVGASVGGVVYIPHEGVDKFMARADAAMYLDKQDRKNK